MSAIFLSTESQSPAAQMIIDCFIEIQQNMDIVSLDKYTDAISTISIIPFCVDEEFKNTFAFLQSVNRNRNPSFSHCRFNLLGDANSMAQPAQIERCNKGMADSLSIGHRSPRSTWSASCSPYCSLGKRWKESRTGSPAFLSKFIVIGVHNG